MINVPLRPQSPLHRQLRPYRGVSPPAPSHLSTTLSAAPIMLPIPTLDDWSVLNIAALVSFCFHDFPECLLNRSSSIPSSVGKVQNNSLGESLMIENGNNIASNALISPNACRNIIKWNKLYLIYCILLHLS